MKPIRRPGRETLAWIEAEAVLQRRRGRELAAAGESLAPRRASWAREFLARLATRGLDAPDGLRRLRPEELPQPPSRRPRPPSPPSGRPHIERYRERASPWRPLSLPGFARGVDYRLLSLEPGRGAASLKLRYRRGLRQPGGFSDSDLELFVLSGSLELGAARHGPGAYLFVPRGVALPALASPRGAELLAFYNDGPPSFTASDSDHPSAERERLVVLDAYDGLPWQAAPAYPAAPAGCLVKVLHVAPQSRALTCLVALAPHFRLDAVRYHDCATEAYLIAGEQWSLQAGPCPAGSYGWRPAYANHGPLRAARGALLLLRSEAELTEHRHANPWSTPAENRAEAARQLRAARPELFARP